MAMRPNQTETMFVLYSVLACVLGLITGFLYLKHPRNRFKRHAKSTIDYFALSGVPAPKPLYDFDIDKAKARPYRPFRWEYHQHMGMLAARRSLHDRTDVYISQL